MMQDIKKILKISPVIAFLAILGNWNLFSEDSPGKSVGKDDPRFIFLSDIPEYPGNVILGRPADHSVTASIMMNSACKVIVEYGTGTDTKKRSDILKLNAGEPKEVLLDGLKADTAYSYRILDADSGKPVLPVTGDYSFHTARLAGSSFVFTVQADSHLDGSCAREIYESSIANALSEKPDFHIDLGDTFMTGKIPERQNALKQYKAQRYYLGLIGHSAPLFLVIGNHDGEETFKKEASEKDGLAVWSCEMRKKYFPNPVPDKFYSGDTEKQKYAGDLQNYYSWTWGDALFVVIDPYWYSCQTNGGTAPWNMTIGKIQYDWLSETLRNSHAKFKFIFIHQLVGGLDKGGRGGTEAAGLYEWGGHEKDGKDTFAANRPGWQKPIHDLLVETGVTMVFHGHDHFFAKQEKDGIIYLLVPQAANRNFKKHQAEEYGYEKGEFLPNSGHMKVTVTPKGVSSEYIRSSIANIRNPPPSRPVPRDSR